MNYGEVTVSEFANILAESVKQARIRNTCIPVEYDTANDLIELGVQVNGLWYLNTKDGFSGTCYYYPIKNSLAAERDLYMRTCDEIAIEVAMLPTREARFQYLKSIRYGARGGHCDFD